MATDTLVFPITADYIRHWTVVDCLRELLANSHDAGHPTWTYDAATGTATIADAGPGLQRDHLLLGVSEKHSADAIGQFGEGLKLALLRLTALNRPWHLETTGFRLTGDFRVHPAYGQRPVFTLTLTPHTRRRGTVVTVSCAPDEWADATALFWRPPLDTLVTPTLARAPTGEAGAVFVQGLRAATVPSPFWYHLADKSLTNRDRTVLDGPRLERALLAFWSTAPLAAWTALAAALRTQPDTYETRLPWPDHPPSRIALLVRRAFAAAWPGVVLADQDDPSRWAQATLAGHPILHVPDAFRRWLGACGLPRLSRLDLPTDPYVPDPAARRWVFPIVRGYARHMTVDDAVLEFAANAVDAGAPRLAYQDGTLTIADDGPGLTPEAFLLGHSTKDGDSTLGRFGRGLKEAWVALTESLGPDAVRIATGDRCYRAAFERHPGFPDHPLWTVTWDTVPTPRAGTTVTIRIDHPNILAAVRRRLPVIDPPPTVAARLLDKPGLLYWHGFALRHGLRLRFGYDLSAAPLAIGPTRAVTQLAAVQKLIAQIWGAVTDPALCGRYLAEAENHPTADDFGTPPTLRTAAARRAWRAAAEARWGAGCVLADPADPGATQRAAYLDHPVVPAHIPETVRTLLRRAGIPSAQAASGPTPGDGPAPAPLAARLTERLAPLQALGWIPAACTVRVWTDPPPNTSVVALYDAVTDTIWVHPDVLPAEWTADAADAFLGALLHELAHRASGARDLSPAFQAALTALIGRLAGAIVHQHQAAWPTHPVRYPFGIRSATGPLVTATASSP